MGDSFDVAHEQADVARALQWAQRLHRAQPKEGKWFLCLSVALHNYAIAGNGAGGRLRPMLRASPERVAYELRALALADSAALAAQAVGNAPAWISALNWRGQMMEYVGFPLEALAAYRQIQTETSGDPNAATRVYWLEAHLRDPLLPDLTRVPRKVVEPRL